ncbi:hypothetical protein GRF29_154g350333 [Pseudopithomyces chartarum]|uniref:Uncharacterized protein n=1 Tax=Pseudopithomyces chartarum TaxID=1892770 RepID=A0AAN6LRV8_9PLEO|nr:hypothetical protein GRF29_154g350333 [Pseudopithomyces chartarum]
MRSSTISSYAALAIGVSALPNQLRKRDWVNDEKGNIYLTLSDETVQIGTVTIDSIFAELGDACATTGTCDSSTRTIDGQLIGAGLGGNVEDITVSLEPYGLYPIWIRNGLLDALHAAVLEVAKCEDIHHQPTCPNPAVYCPAEPITVNECTVPRFWGINYQGGDPNSGPPQITTTVDLSIKESGFCETFTTIGSAVAGAINGVGGGIFSLIGLACQ